MSLIHSIITCKRSLERCLVQIKIQIEENVIQTILSLSLIASA